MAGTQTARDTRLKAQVFDAIIHLETMASAKELFAALQDTTIFKQSDYAALILFQLTDTTRERGAKVVAAHFAKSMALPKVGQRLSPRTASWLWAAGTNIPMNEGNIQREARFALFADEKSIHSLLAIALKTNQHLGWLIFMRNTPNAFSTDDARLAQFLEPYISQSIETLQQVKSYQDQLSRTRRLFDFEQEIMRVAHTADVYQKIVQLFLSMGSDVCLLATMIDTKNDDIPVKIASLEHKNAKFDTTDYVNHTYSIADYPIMSELRGSKEPVVVNNLKKDAILSFNEREFFGSLKIKAAVILYLQSQADGTPLGYLILGYLRPRPFTDGHISFFKLLAEQVARAIDFNLKLESSQQRARQLETGAKISEIASRIMDETQIINQAVELIKEGFELYYVGLFLLDSDGLWAVLRAGSGDAGREQIAAKHKLAANSEESMIGWAISNRRARIALDIGQDAVRFENPYLPKTHSEMALPLISQGQVLGAMSIQSEAVAAFSQDEITTLQIMADQLANAILNARLYKNVSESSQRLNSLLEINREISASGDLQQLLDNIIRHAAELSQADQGTIFMLQGDVLIPKSVVGGFAEEMMSMTVAVGQGVSGSAAQLRQPVTKIFENPTMGVQIPGTPEVPESLAAVPIQTETQVIGVMLVRRIDNIQPFSNSDIALLEGMAHQAAIAWKNLTLLASIENNYRREQMIRQLVARIHGESGVQNILQTTVTELTKALNAPGGAVRLQVKPQTGPRNPQNESSQNSNGTQSLSSDKVER